MKSKQLILTLTRKVYDLEGRLKALHEEAKSVEQDLKDARAELDEAFSGVSTEPESEEIESVSLRDRILSSLSRKPKKTRDLFDALNEDLETNRNSLNTYLSRMKSAGEIDHGDNGTWSVSKD